MREDKLAVAIVFAVKNCFYDGAHFARAKWGIFAVFVEGFEYHFWQNTGLLGSSEQLDGLLIFELQRLLFLSNECSTEAKKRVNLGTETLLARAFPRDNGTLVNNLGKLDAGISFGSFEYEVAREERNVGSISIYTSRDSEEVTECVEIILFVLHGCSGNKPPNVRVEQFGTNKSSRFFIANMVSLVEDDPMPFDVV